MKRAKDYYRYQRNRSINRKFEILKKTWGEETAEGSYGNKKKGKLSKGKIHCSCGICRRKSYIELTHSDKMKLVSYKQSIHDYMGEDKNILW